MAQQLRAPAALAEDLAASQHPQGSSQPPVTPAPGHRHPPVASVDTYEHSTQENSHTHSKTGFLEQFHCFHQFHDEGLDFYRQRERQRSLIISPVTHFISVGSACVCKCSCVRGLVSAAVCLDVGTYMWRQARGHQCWVFSSVTLHLIF